MIMVCSNYPATLVYLFCKPIGMQWANTVAQYVVFYLFFQHWVQQYDLVEVFFFASLETLRVNNVQSHALMIGHVSFLSATLF